jgi:outer membrane protein assembly factor BamB
MVSSTFAGVMNPRIFASLTLTVAFASAALASDWPFIRGPLGDGSSPEKISKRWPDSGPKAIWRVPSERGFSSFAVSGGQAFTIEQRDVEGVSQEVVVARHADTGKEVWLKALGAAKFDGGGDAGTGDNKGGDGPRSSPTVDGGRVYVTTGKLALVCLAAQSGEELWRHDLLKEFAGRNIQWQNAASPLVEGDLVLVAGGGAGESLLAFNKTDGRVAWKAFDETMTHATPTAATIHGQRQVIFFVKSGLLAVEPSSGRELWRYAFPFRISTAASPVVAGDIVYCSAGYGVGAGAVKLVRADGKFTATEIYRLAGDKPLANHWSTPVLHNGHLYGMFQFKEYGSGPVKCVEVATGKVKWEKSGFGPGHVVLVDGHVLALGDAGQLVLIKATPDKYEEVARAQVLSGKCWTTPVVAGGRVYARSTKEAVSLDLGLKSASAK